MQGIGLFAICVSDQFEYETSDVKCEIFFHVRHFKFDFFTILVLQSQP